MTDTLRDRIAAVIAQHAVCMCGEWAENMTEQAQHQADAVIAELGARQEWTYAWNDFESVGHGPPMSHDHASAASAMVDGAIITRYVTDWEADV